MRYVVLLSKPLRAIIESRDNDYSTQMGPVYAHIYTFNLEPHPIAVPTFRIDYLDDMLS